MGNRKTKMDMELRALDGGRGIGLVAMTPGAKRLETTFVTNKKYVKIVTRYVKKNNINVLNNKIFKGFDL